MDNVVRGSDQLVLRHQLDGLSPTSVITVRLATPQQLAGLAAIARQEIPGVTATGESLTRFLYDNPESIFAFQRSEILLGGIAFLHLNCRGHEALLLDDIDLKAPSRDLLARPDEPVSAMYVWGLAGYGRAALGLANVNEYLRKPRFIGANYLARSSTPAGRNLLMAIGFQPIPSFQNDLWSYERSWNGASKILPASLRSERSFADARH
jgi:hypothetical protein